MNNYRIAAARNAKGWSQKDLAKKIGTTQQQIARYESGANDVKSSVLLKLSAALGVTVSYLLALDDDPSFVSVVSSDTVPVPVLGRIAAGTPRAAFSQSDDYHDTQRGLVASHPHAFWLVVAGNSMNRLFPEGALVLVDPDVEVHSGDVGAIFVNGDDATIKRVYFEDGTVRLHPESWDPDYRDRTIDPSDPDAPAVRVIGRAVSYTAPDGWRG
ncbi:LexA family transcriptional regulator [Parafannyhessea umbonata]|uniref:LexA family protein n=1 Tax=Parafannyhessea umbonata TaxID=604330 RepID=UPI002A80F046|nr:LexA family transcriptional regulator [Parafannyhessea umbonata]MDY4014380.1 LexA family transcriptional regulator [Parafannyhessea umbonata]